MHAWHARHRKGGVEDNLLDRGQPVVLEAWVDAATGRARVKPAGQRRHQGARVQRSGGRWGKAAHVRGHDQ